LADAMKRAGFNVELQATDWATLLARRASKTGWNAFGVTIAGFDVASPLTNFYVTGNCIDYPGWQCDDRVTKLLPQFVKATTLDERRHIADELQTVLYDSTPAVMWGQFAQPAAYRVSLRNMIPSAIPIFWNVEK
jgi:peptide/nickel transport system substrate-binding protein